MEYTRHTLDYLVNHLLDSLSLRVFETDQQHRRRLAGRPQFTLYECARIDGQEPLLQDDQNASPLALPYSDAALGELVDRLRDSHWRHEEIHMDKDRHDFKALEDEDVKYVLRKVLWFFAFGDNLVVENLVGRFANEIKRDVVTTFYSFQIANEEEHKLTYARLLNTILDTPESLQRILQDDQPALKCVAEWIECWILDRRMPFAYRLLAFVFIEGVFFTSCFAFIYWLRTHNLFPGLGKSNEFIARDENLHALFACHLYKHHVRYQLSAEDIRALATDAIQICDQFIDAMFDQNRIMLLGMNGVMMKKYVRHVTNYYMAKIGVQELVFPEAYNPFPFMIQQSLEGKTNFFESDVSEYKKSAHILSEEYAEDDDF